MTKDGTNIIAKNADKMSVALVKPFHKMISHFISFMGSQIYKMIGQSPNNFFSEKVVITPRFILQYSVVSNNCTGNLLCVHMKASQDVCTCYAELQEEQKQWVVESE